jgi:putative nucleotidyltransferase with HDIG domain
MSEPLTILDVVEKAKSLPCSPVLLPKLISLLSSSESNIQEIERFVKQDASLTAVTMKVANSAFFSGSGNKCESLNDALFRLGFREMYRIVATTMSGKWLSQGIEGYGWEPGDLYKHSICVAVSAEILAKKKKNIAPEIAYTAGLLHDVGKLAIAFACADKFDAIRQLVQEKQIAWRLAELEILGFDHTQVGAELLKNWQFPDNFIEIAQFYPRPSEARPEFFEIVTHIHASKHLAVSMGVGVGEEGFSTEIDDAALERFGFNGELIEECMPQILQDSEKMFRNLTQE